MGNYSQLSSQYTVLNVYLVTDSFGILCKICVRYFGLIITCMKWWVVFCAVFVCCVCFIFVISSKLTLFIQGSSISSKLFFLEVQYGSSLIDPVLLQEET